MRYLPTFFLVLFGLAVFALGGVAGSVTTYQWYGQKVAACAKEHNVYECRMVAVPVAQPEWVK